MNLKINKEFEELIPPLTIEEEENLENSLKNEGCRDALVVWNGTIVDGHHRYKICKNTIFLLKLKKWISRMNTMPSCG